MRELTASEGYLIRSIERAINDLLKLVPVDFEFSKKDSAILDIAMDMVAVIQDFVREE